ncbi:hypothetical protein KAFR_0F04410 [Kazachstania africana CBS 2517]|uniref:Amino acid permease/ SLC12A domain-containing protein n=1 Tax=Kazachstania africana (strain ATCC 22294 / BCRC 22015 / CBS 2517 / CECT 1963 / NBRC 1671 / NRRL Y-8276) TaxID=1071382 RepID=H2AXD6_KAZAF|nr:hypothetical protein KAFR_0F04410 [Kazachstania africana CBS 2517]CCF59036.1 hypothetical protein KAFR_0F04410 [Kazachstania africana CBS 2517]
MLVDTKENSSLRNDSVSTSISSIKDTSLLRNFKNSFKRVDQDQNKFDDEKYNSVDEGQKRLVDQPLRKTLQQRHLTMIAIGGTLGTGLFIGLGESLASGPGSLLIGYIIVGIAVFCVVQSAAELSCQYPVSGSYATLVTRFMNESFGFTVATNYCLAWLVCFPSELVGSAMVIRYWNDSVNSCVWIAIFWVFVMCLNLFGVEGYAETEFWLSIIKIIAIIIFIIIGIVLICGGGPNSTGYIGTKYWHDPGSFAHPVFKSLCNTFVSAAYSFGGCEIVVLTSAESRKISSIARAAKGTFWRITIFYLVTIVIIGCLVPYTDNKLISATSSEDVTASPFVIALSNCGAMGTRVSHFMNTVILVSTISVSNSCVYASSRIIQALGAMNQLPSICGYIDRRGRPLVGIAICGLFGLLGFLVAAENEAAIFTWLYSLTSVAYFVTWFSICWCQVRFRMALKRQGRSNDEIAYKSMLGIYGGYVGAILNIVLIIGEVYISIFPLNESPSANIFFQNCLSIPIMLVSFFGHKIYCKGWKDWFVRAKDIDLDTGNSITDFEIFKAEIEEEKERIASSPLYYRIYRFWC